MKMAILNDQAKSLLGLAVYVDKMDGRVYVFISFVSKFDQRNWWSSTFGQFHPMGTTISIAVRRIWQCSIRNLVRFI